MKNSDSLEKGRMIHIIICDDELNFAVQLSEKIKELISGPKSKVKVDIITKPEAITADDYRKYDIAFLDIDMGEVNGLQLARQLRKTRKDIVLIFVTNYNEYAPEGYEVAAFRFLPKSQLDEKLPQYFEAAIEVCRKERDTIVLTCDKEDTIISPACLAYVETHERHLRLHMINYQPATLNCAKTMGQLEDLLINHGFLRVHQSFLVNMRYIRKMNSTGVWLNTGEKIPISARNYMELKKCYLEWKGKNQWNIY